MDPARYGIPQSGTFDLTGIVHVGKKSDPAMPKTQALIERILDHLKKTYCGRIAYEFRHIPVCSLYSLELML